MLSAQMPTEPLDFAALIRPWAKQWGLPGIEAGISVRFSTRLKRSLGRSWPRRGEIVLHPKLRDAKPTDLAMVVCHEAAHIASYQLYGGKAAPHGAEWAALVSSVGFAPVTRVSALGAIQVAPKSRGPLQPTARRLVLHRCPVCQSKRVARRIVSGWRCAECVAAGLDGLLETTVIPAHA